MSRSRSHVLQCDPAERERVLVRVHALTGTHADLAGQEAVDLPYLTVTWAFAPQDLSRREDHAPPGAERAAVSPGL